MPDRHAVLSERDGRAVLRFERVLAQPPERVWRALTARPELDAWHPTPFEIDAETLTFIPTKGAPEMPAGRLLACEEPRLLVHTWGEDELRWTLSPHEDGCLLTLEHTFDDRFKAARDGAGWHLCLRSLTAALDRLPIAERTEGERLPEGWSELNDVYQRRFGIAPEQATPVPPR
jgi:uncharacterized protein YndB with AHSA1/START domain